MKVLDMFCGMSAFRTAAEQIGGFSFVGYCDNDPTAVAAYRTLYKTEALLPTFFHELYMFL